MCDTYKWRLQRPQWRQRRALERTCRRLGEWRFPRPFYTQDHFSHKVKCHSLPDFISPPFPKLYSFSSPFFRITWAFFPLISGLKFARCIPFLPFRSQTRSRPSRRAITFLLLLLLLLPSPLSLIHLLPLFSYLHIVIFAHSSPSFIYPLIRWDRFYFPKKHKFSKITTKKISGTASVQFNQF